MKTRSVMTFMVVLGLALTLAASVQAGKGGGGRGYCGGWQQGGGCTNVCNQQGAQLGRGQCLRLRDGSCTNATGQVGGPAQRRLRDGSGRSQ
jgi:hypothetical protein